jgi:hypothetical protein
LTKRALLGLVIALAGSAVLGLAGGLLWGEVAPRPLLQEVGSGSAQLVNAETRAFIEADAWFGGIGAVAGLATGIAGYALGVARRPAPTRLAVTIGLLAGALAGGYLMLWLGQQIGLSAYQHQLADASVGTSFHASLNLGAKSTLAFWPLLTGVVIVLGEVGRRTDHGSAPGTGPGQQPGYASPAGPPQAPGFGPNAGPGSGPNGGPGTGPGFGAGYGG